MCGIVGFTGEPSPDKLKTMTAVITHRGPDDDAELSSATFHCGMRRLSIIDLTDNLYPMQDENGLVQVVFNGEIYNYLELREELIQLGHSFRSDSDSEVIVQSYLAWGTAFLDRLRGMFSIALYDKNKDEMLLARDRLGIKPLYYTEYEDRLIFASEIKAIFAAWPVERTPDDFAVYKFLANRVHDDGKRTFFKEIKRLLPGHFMTIDNQGNFRTERYWTPEVNTQFKSTKSDTEYAEELKEQFLDSMRHHLIADVPLGVTLSGGLDSSAVAGAASQLLREGTDLHTDNQLFTFSAIHPGESIDEQEYINEVVEFTNAKSFKVEPKLEEFWEEIETWMYYQEEPTISTAPYAYYCVMRMASPHVKVLLSGQGGDELFAGYIPYFKSYINSAQAAGAYLDIAREVFKGADLYLSFIRQQVDSQFHKGRQLDVREMLNLEEMDELQEQEGSIYFTHKRNLNERLFQDVTQSSVPNLLRYEDKNSMAHSIESRVPLLDYKFVEYAFGLPIDQKIKNGWNRYVYRNAMQGLMPEKNRLRRSKVGFVNAEWEWMREKADHIAAIFNSGVFRARKYWDANIVLAEFLLWIDGKKRGDGLMFWRILSTELWLRQYVDEFKQLPHDGGQLRITTTI